MGVLLRCDIGGIPAGWANRKGFGLAKCVYTVLHGFFLSSASR